MTERPPASVETFEFQMTMDDLSSAVDTYFRATHDGKLYGRMLLLSAQFILLFISIWIGARFEDVLLGILYSYATLNVLLFVSGGYLWVSRKLRRQHASNWSFLYGNMPATCKCTIRDNGITFSPNEVDELKLPWGSVRNIQTEGSSIHIQLPLFLAIPGSAFKTPADAERTVKRMHGLVHMAYGSGLLNSNINSSRNS